MIHRRLSLIVCCAAWLAPGGACLRAAIDLPLVAIAEVNKSGLHGESRHIKGVITGVDASLFFLQDVTGAMVVQQPNARGKFTKGDVVDVQGALVKFSAGLQIQASDTGKTGKQPLPEPETVALAELFEGGARNQLVRTRAAVHDVALVGNEIRLLLQARLDPTRMNGPGANTFILWWRLDPSEPLKRPDHLLDAVIEVTGVALRGTWPDGSTPSLSRLVIESLDDIKVVQPGAADYSNRPGRTLASLRVIPGPDSIRVRVRATVTFYSASGWFYLDDGTGTARGGRACFPNLPPDQRRSSLSSPDLRPGDQIELVGLPFLQKEHEGKFMPWLLQCEWRVIGHAAPPPFEPVSAATIFGGHFDGRSSTVVGRVTDIGSLRDSVGGLINHTLTLEDEGDYFTALIQSPTRLELPVKVGDYARIDGIVKTDQDELGATKSFRLNVNNVADLRSTTRPWRPARLLPWLLGAAAMALIVSIWIVSLRRQVRRQTAELVETNRRLARFKNVADTTTELVAMASLDKRPLYFNPAGRALLGISPEEDVTKLNFSEIYTRDSLELFEREGYAHAFRHGHWEAELTMKHRDGSEIPVSFMGLVLTSPDGAPICMSCIARDITARKMLDKQLRDALEHERELNQLKGSFVNTISHEFRTPLGIILFAASMLRRFDARFGAEERARQLDTIDEAVERMNNLVEQSLSLGRAEAAKPQMSQFDPGGLCRRVVDEVMSSTSHRSPITFITDNGSHPGCSDEVMLRAILMNLLGNAVKYSPPASPISLHLAREGEVAIFTVRDHGPGLRAEDMPKLFTTFHRGSHPAGIPGTGLGLAIVKRCAEALGGSVAACNADDGGAQFTVRLPIFSKVTDESNSRPSHS